MYNEMVRKNQDGQSLVELVIALSVTMVVITALIIMVLNGLKNAQFAKNQAIATKLAQEGIELVRVIKEKGTEDRITNGSDCGSIQVTKFNELWECRLTSPTDKGWFFKLDPNQLLLGTTASNLMENVDTNFQRLVIISDKEETFATEKTITVKVFWSDSSGQHESYLETILTKR